ncbi:ArsR/SmtB family transcription factor [Arcanobacterium ihumii]|uniref:ArsR/SmtB family transcription factor n=1 Tax=Arcanobacterium ihumii TaxID=2138162 RepID=UPI00190F5A55|nr:metalloregulator ArsR/SmtB family transcription factor [Arcanobacterium ihumii]
MTIMPLQSNPKAPLLVSALFKSLADPHRLMIVQHLLLGEHRVSDLVEHLDLAQSTVSTHIGRLRDTGLLDSHTHGRATFYTLAHPAATRTLLAAAEHVLACTGEPVDLCFINQEENVNNDDE